MLNQSIVQQRGAVPFPAFMGERVYMREFRKETGLPTELRGRWQHTVDAMLDGVDTDGPIYLMIDQGLVKAGNTQRRPGMHIDGYWNPAVHAHSSRHGGSHISCHSGDHIGWDNCDFSYPEGLILASDISACRALSGNFSGMPGEGGDCSHLELNGMSEVILAANTAYAGNVTMLHESLPVEHDVYRTLVRLNVPGWSPVIQ